VTESLVLLQVLKQPKMSLVVRVALLALVYFAVSDVKGSQDVMKQMTINFGKALDSCKKEVSCEEPYY
jgi:hypothetical protein